MEMQTGEGEASANVEIDVAAELPGQTAAEGDGAIASKKTLTPSHSPKLAAREKPEERIEVTYTTKSGETVTTYKPIAPEPLIALSEMEDRPVTGITLVGCNHWGMRHLANIVENKGCRARFVVEDDADLRAKARAELENSHCYNYEIVGFKDFARAFTSPLIDLVPMP